MFIFVFYFVCIVFQQHIYIYTLALLLFYNFFSSKVDEDCYIYNVACYAYADCPTGTYPNNDVSLIACTSKLKSYLLYRKPLKIIILLKFILIFKLKLNLISYGLFSIFLKYLFYFFYLSLMFSFFFF